MGGKGGTITQLPGTLQHVHQCTEGLVHHLLAPVRWRLQTTSEHQLRCRVAHDSGCARSMLDAECSRILRPRCSLASHVAQRLETLLKLYDQDVCAPCLKYETRYCNFTSWGLRFSFAAVQGLTAACAEAQTLNPAFMQGRWQWRHMLASGRGGGGCPHRSGHAPVHQTPVAADIGPKGH